MNKADCGSHKFQSGASAILKKREISQILWGIQLASQQKH